MPFYEYECAECGVREEKKRDVRERNRKFSCLRCHGDMKRVVSLPGVIFKGDGWPGQDIKRKKS